MRAIDRARVFYAAYRTTLVSKDRFDGKGLLILLSTPSSNAFLSRSISDLLLPPYVSYCTRYGRNDSIMVKTMTPKSDMNDN